MILRSFLPAVLLVAAAAEADIRTARALLEKGEVSRALQEIEAALRDAPGNPEVQYQAGELLRELGAERAERLRHLAPDSAEAHELLGRSLESRGQLDAALAEYRAALRNSAGLPGIHFLIGNLLWKKRDFSMARPELESELRLNPNHTLAHLRLGQILLNLNEPEAAMGHLRTAVAADPSSIEAHRALGRAYRALGRHREALGEFQTVASQRPNDDSVHAQLGGEYRALGNADQARAELEIHRRLLAAKAAAARQK